MCCPHSIRPRRGFAQRGPKGGGAEVPAVCLPPRLQQTSQGGTEGLADPAILPFGRGAAHRFRPHWSGKVFRLACKWRARRQSKHLVAVPWFPASRPTWGFQASAPPFLHFLSIPSSGALAASVFPPIQGAIPSLSPLVSAPGPDGNFPVAFCGSPILQFTTQCLQALRALKTFRANLDPVWSLGVVITKALVKPPLWPSSSPAPTQLMAALSLCWVLSGARTRGTRGVPGRVRGAGTRPRLPQQDSWRTASRGSLRGCVICPLPLGLHHPCSSASLGHASVAAHPASLLSISP